MTTLTRRHLSRDVHTLLDLKCQNFGHTVHADRVIRAIFNSIINALRRGEKVYVKGFGTFHIATWKPRGSGNNFIDPYRNRSPVPLKHPAKRKVAFKPAPTLTAMLNGPLNYKERYSVRSWNLPTSS